MKEEIYLLLEELNSLSNGELIKTDLKEYVNKIYSKAKIISYHDKGQLIGFIAYYDNAEDKNTAYLTMLAVNPIYQGKGFGKRFLENAIALLVDESFKSFKLEVLQKEKNIIKLYEEYGFCFLENNFDTLYMIKKL